MLIALLAGFLSATGFAPLGFWPVTLACFVLLVHLIRQASTNRAAFACGYWFGVGHFTVGLNWIAGSFAYQSAMPAWLGWIAVLALSLYLAVYPAFAALFAARVGRAWSDAAYVMVFAAGWILTEFARATLFTGFAWNPLSVAFLKVAEASAWVGTYGVSGLLCLLAGGLWLGFTRRWRAGLTLAGATVLILLTPALLMLGRADAPQTQAPLLRVVQPNIGQQDKHVPAYEAVNFRKLEAATGAPGPVPRLIFWPEAAIPDYLQEDAGARLRLASLIGPKDLLLTGGVALDYDEEGYAIGARNSVFVLAPDGSLKGRYDKAHLVPYGEYLPMRPVLSAIGLSRLVPGDLDFWPGPGAQTLDLPGFGKVGLQICYEMIFSGKVVERANRPAFIFNPSNDAWFGAWGPPQHLAQAQLRAMEEGLPVVRSTPTGISAVIDASGRLVASVPYGQAGAIDQLLPPAAAPTAFARFGNVLPLALALGMLLGAIATRRRLR